MAKGHRMVKKNFEAKMWVDGQKMPLNHFVQETIANVMLGFSKTLKGLDSAPEKIEVKIEACQTRGSGRAHVPLT